MTSPSIEDLPNEIVAMKIIPYITNKNEDEFNIIEEKFIKWYELNIYKKNYGCYRKYKVSLF